MNSFNAKKIGFWIGIAIFVCIYFMPVPDGLSNEGKLTAAIFLLMGIWWATEAMPLYATALLPGMVHGVVVQIMISKLLIISNDVFITGNLAKIVVLM